MNIDRAKSDLRIARDNIILALLLLENEEEEIETVRNCISRAESFIHDSMFDVYE